MNYTFQLNNKTNKESLASVKNASVENQNAPICMTGVGNDAFYCGLLGDDNTQADKK